MFYRLSCALNVVTSSTIIVAVYNNLIYYIFTTAHFNSIFFANFLGNAEPKDVRDFLQRAAFQAWLGTHPYLVDMIGCCSNQKPYYMLLECVEPGSLLQFLWDCRRVRKKHTVCVFAN